MIKIYVPENEYKELKILGFSDMCGSMRIVLFLKLFPHSCSNRHLEIDLVAPSAHCKTGVVLSVCLSPLKPAQYLDSMELKGAQNEDLVGQF